MPLRPLVLLSLLLVIGACSDPSTDDDDATGDDDDSGTTDDDSGTTDDDSGAADDDTTVNPDDQDGDGFKPDDGDCNDLDPSVYPGAPEAVCDQVDSDCDGWGEGIAAAIGDMEFASLAGAATAVTDGDTLEVCPGTYTDQVLLPEDVTCSLTSHSGDRDDTILDGQELHTVVYLGNNSTVAISHLTVRNGRGQAWISGQHHGGGVMSLASSLTLDDCAFTDNVVAGGSYSEGGALAVYRNLGEPGATSVSVSGCYFEGNEAHVEGGAQGGAIFVAPNNHEPVTVTIEDSTFIDNTTLENGGAVMIGHRDAPATVTLSGCTFEGNSTEIHSGGALWVGYWEVLSINDCTFLNNACPDLVPGGAVRVDGPMGAVAFMSVLDTVFEGNTGFDAGAMAIESTAGDATTDLCLDGVTFLGNSAAHYGGALGLSSHGEDYVITMTDVDFVDNVSEYIGGALLIENTDGHVQLQMDGGSFTGNQAEVAGAALHTANQLNETALIQITMNGVLIDSNTIVAGDYALWCSAVPMELTLDGCTLTNNSCTGAGLRDEEGVTLVSIDTDWGTGATDNTPHDVGFYNGLTYDTYGANASFTCSGTLGCY